METVQNIIILVLLLISTYLYFDKKHLVFWKDYYKNEYNEILDWNQELESKLTKAEEIISQQKEELVTRKTKKK